MSLVEPTPDLTPPAIRRRSAAERDGESVSFAALRSLGIAATQALSGDVWTDYNLHDPGVTTLEALAYALTELAYRADQPVADHLCQADGSIAYERQSLFRPDDILRCRASTENDYRRLLLDGVAGLADAQFAAPRAPGLHRLRLRLADRRAGDDASEDAVKAARRIYRAARTVGEDLDAVEVVPPTLCTLFLVASISGTRDAADILAEIYRECAAHIAGHARVASLGEAVREGGSLADVLEGPLTVNGLIAEDDLPRGAQEGPVQSDLRSLILQVDGVIEVLEVEVDKRPPPDGAWAPVLQMPGDLDDAGDAALVEQITFLRRGVRVPLDPRAVANRRGHRFHPKLPAGETRDAFEAVVKPPVGRPRQPLEFQSVQEEFPVIYGLGRRGAGGAGNGSSALARVEQFKGYLTLFDQLLANGGAQLMHIRDLFTTDAAPDRSYWRHILNDRDSPGVERLQAAPASELLSEVYAPFDAAADRRGKVLDHLLALYGESCTQNTLRQFLDHLDSHELAVALLENKAEYLRQVLRLGRDRGQGFDVAVDPWGPPHAAGEATTGLHARICLLLGFRFWRARALTRRLGGSPPPRRRRAAARAAQAAPAPGEPLPYAMARALNWVDAPPRTAAGVAALRRLRRDTHLQAALLANAANRDRFRWRPLPGAGAGEGPAGDLLLTDTEGRWRDLGRFETEAAAAEVAQRLRRRAVRLNDACEGVHIVEHVLLRPRAPAAAETTDWDFHALRLTVVFPGWTGRTARPGFRRFAAETVEINVPAHVAADCLWLSFADLCRFEGLYAAWTARLRAHARAASTAAVTALDAASAALATFLREALKRQAAETELHHFVELYAAWTARRRAYARHASDAAARYLASAAAALAAFLDEAPAWQRGETDRGRFKDLYRAWTERLRGHAQDASDAAARRLDTASDDLDAFLREALERRRRQDAAQAEAI